MKKTRKLKRIAVLMLVVAMIFGSTINTSYAENIDVAEPPAQEETVKPAETEATEPAEAVVPEQPVEVAEEAAEPADPVTEEKPEIKTEDPAAQAETSAEENLDHITGDETANPYPIILDENESSLDKAQTRRMLLRRNVLRATGSDVPAPGQVKLYKTAEPVTGKFNTFKVTLRMEATDVEQKNDIVLVIDTSGSMADNGRMTEAKKAAKNFVNTLLDEGHPQTRIALVSFESDAYLVKGFRDFNGKQELLGAIDGLRAEGGTFTQGGIKKAEDMLAESTADYKNIVLLSDGVPTFNYKIRYPNAHLINGGPGLHTYERQTGPNIPQADFNYDDTTGAGNNMWYEYERVNIGVPILGPYEYHYYNSGNCAIAEAGYAKAIAKMYTVAVKAGDMGVSVLTQMATPGNAYNTEDPTALTGIFAEIAASIASAMSDISVTDPMGVGFEVKGGTPSDVTVTQGTKSIDGNTISWNVGETLTSFNSENPTVKYAEMTYEVEVNDTILGTESADGNYNTNAGASVSYTDIDGNPQAKMFPEPTAEPLLVGFYKEIKDSNGAIIPDDKVAEREVTYNMQLKADGSNKDYAVKPGTPRVMTDLKIDKEYLFKETDGADAYDSATIKWVTFDGTQEGSVAGTTLDNFVVPKNDDKPLNTRIIVTNKEKADGKLTLTKIFKESILRGESDAPKAEYKVKVIGKSPYFEGVTVYEQEHVLEVGKPLLIENLPYGIYTVTEEEGYTPIFQPTSGEVTISFENREAMLTVINENNETTDFTATKVWKGGPKADHVIPMFILLANGEPYDVDPEVTPEETPSDEYTYTWKDLPKYKDNGDVIVYTVKEEGVNDDDEFTINEHKYSVEINKDGNKITNTYVIPTTPEGEDIKATKAWVDGPAEKPTIWLRLYRQIEGGTPEAVNDAAIVELANGDTEASWAKVELTDFDGNPYTFSVKEVDAEGNELKLDHYKTSYDGLTVTNTYFENPAITLEKTAKEASYTKAGDKITYVFTIENTGDVEITNVKLNDTMLGIEGELVAESLKPGERKIVEKVYVVTENDVKEGKIVNAASVVGATLTTEPTAVAAHTISFKKAPEAPKTPETGDRGIGMYALIAIFAATAFAAITARKKLS